MEDTMFELKTLTKEAVGPALEKAHRYRLLNEPAEAESICLDVLAIDPDNKVAVTTLLLALTDQFETRSTALSEARSLLDRFADQYDRYYYGGIIREREGKARWRSHGPGSGFGAYDCLCEAMELYEKAAAIRPPGNDDAILRWNSSARLINRYSEIRPQPQQTAPTMLE